MYQSAITLKRISALSGFSISTVSKALNDKTDISTKTRKAIQSIAQKHNYVPNYAAISLRKQQTKTLAIILPRISDKFYGELLGEIQKHTFNSGYRLLVFQSFASQKKEKECFKLINDGSVDGALVLSASKNNKCLIDKLEVKNNVPTVFLEEQQSDYETVDIKDLAKMYFNELLIKAL